MAQQSFEQTFFSWLGNYRDMLNSISCEVDDRELKGRPALTQLWKKYLEKTVVSRDAETRLTEFSNEEREGDSSPFDDRDENEALFANDPNINTEVSDARVCKLLEKDKNATVKLNWSDLYRRNEYQLDSLFRNIYQLILWIDSQNDNRMIPAQKWLYINIVKAQLSWIEMVYLFYNGYTERGESFKKLVEKYALFDNLNFDSDPVIKHLKTNAPNENRYSEAAYDSRLARRALGLPEST